MRIRHVRLALRRLRRNPVYAVLNGIGLAVGLAVVLLIGLYVYHEHTYDRYHAEADRVVRFTVAYGEFGTLLRVPAQAARGVAGQRTKEMSIRKVLGATIGQVVLRLNREFVALVGLAFVLAAPLAFWLATRWLRNFAYAVDVSPTLFLLAGGLTLGAALLPVSYHALRTASADPTTTLRND